MTSTEKQTVIATAAIVVGSAVTFAGIKLTKKIKEARVRKTLMHPETETPDLR